MGWRLPCVMRVRDSLARLELRMSYSRIYSPSANATFPLLTNQMDDSFRLLSAIPPPIQGAKGQMHLPAVNRVGRAKRASEKWFARSVGPSVRRFFATACRGAEAGYDESKSTLVPTTPPQARAAGPETERARWNGLGAVAVGGRGRLSCAR